jgi:hypothetical protein
LRAASDSSALGGVLDAAGLRDSVDPAGTSAGFAVKSYTQI